MLAIRHFCRRFLSHDIIYYESSPFIATRNNDSWTGLLLFPRFILMVRPVCQFCWSCNNSYPPLGYVVYFFYSRQTLFIILWDVSNYWNGWWPKYLDQRKMLGGLCQQQLKRQVWRKYKKPVPVISLKAFLSNDNLWQVLNYVFNNSY